MTQQFAMALINYLNRCVPIVPTTGMEWSAISDGLKVIEQLANGRIEISIVEKKFPQESVGDRGAGA